MLLENQEKINFSSNINNFENGESKSRILMITNKYIFIIRSDGTIEGQFMGIFDAKSNQKKRINMKDLVSITVSSNPKSTEMILNFT